MTALSAAERKRRQREREKAAADPVRAFLRGIVEDADREMSGENGHKPRPWLVRQSAEALDLLAQLDGDSQQRPHLLICLSGTRSEEEIDQAYREFDREFEKHVRVETRSRAAEASEIEAKAFERVIWANEQRVKGTATSTTIAAGISAVKRVIGTRHSVAYENARDQFAKLTNLRDILHALEGEPPVRVAP